MAAAKLVKSVRLIAVHNYNPGITSVLWNHGVLLVGNAIRPKTDTNLDHLLAILGDSCVWCGVLAHVVCGVYVCGARMA